jgi:predicted nucleic acid-binding protein
MIAGTAKAHGLTVITHNLKDFSGDFRRSEIAA